MVTHTAVMPFNSHFRKLIQTGTHSIHFESIWLCKRPPELELKSPALNSDRARPSNTSREIVLCRRSGFSVLFSFLIKVESYNSIKTIKQKSTIKTKRWRKNKKQKKKSFILLWHRLPLPSKKSSKYRFNHILLALKRFKIHHVKRESLFINS